MLKRKIILGAMLAITSLPTWANGFYVGAGVGRDMGNFNTASTTRIDDPVFGPSSGRTVEDAGADGLLGDIFTGYLWQLTPKFSLAGELNVEGSSMEHTSSTGDSNGIVWGRNKSSIDRTVGLGILPGFQIASKIRMYGRLGVVRSNFNSDTLFGNSDRDIVSVSDSRALNGLRYGLGLETDLTSHTGLRLEYTHTNYQAYEKNNVYQADENKLYQPTVSNDLRITPNTDQVVLAMVYRFA